MAMNLPWKPRVVFTGTSDYVLDVGSGEVVEHVDAWDSLSKEGNEAFPSLEGVKDLIGLVARKGGDGVGEMLRRSAEYEIRRYDGENVKVLTTINGVDEMSVNEGWKGEFVAREIKGTVSKSTVEDLVRSVENEGAAEFDACRKACVVGYSGGRREVWVEASRFCVRAPTPM